MRIRIHATCVHVDDHHKAHTEKLCFRAESAILLGQHRWHTVDDSCGNLIEAVSPA